MAIFDVCGQLEGFGGSLVGKKEASRLSSYGPATFHQTVILMGMVALILNAAPLMAMRAWLNACSFHIVRQEEYDEQWAIVVYSPRERLGEK